MIEPEDCRWCERSPNRHCPVGPDGLHEKCRREVRAVRGIDPDDGPRKVTEIAALLGLSGMQVRNILFCALKKIRIVLDGNRVCRRCGGWGAHGATGFQVPCEPCGARGYFSPWDEPDNYVSAWMRQPYAPPVPK